VHIRKLPASMVIISLDPICIWFYALRFQTDYRTLAGYWILFNIHRKLFEQNCWSQAARQANKDFRSQARRELNMKSQGFKPLSDVARSIGEWLRRFWGWWWDYEKWVEELRVELLLGLICMLWLSDRVINALGQWAILEHFGSTSPRQP